MSGPRKDSAPGGTRFASLDGLRASAIALVMLSHLIQFHGSRLRVSGAVVGDLGYLGVRIFFILSGFLITQLLLREEHQTGTISLRHFYLRRTLRIFPAFYAFLLVISLASVAGYVTVAWRDQLAAATYTMNFFPQRGWYLGHTWSLAVEEQFYLLWPGVFLLAGARRRTHIAIGAMVAAPLLRIATFALAPSWRATIDESFPTIMDPIATGAALALLRPTLHSILSYRSALASRALYLLPLAILGMNTLNWHWTMPGWIVGETLLNVLIAFGVDRAVTHPDGAVGRLLNLRSIAWMGTLSYSLYLWQQPFLVAGGTNLLQRFPGNLCAAFLAALASYSIIERPFLRLKSRFGPTTRSVRPIT